MSLLRQDIVSLYGFCLFSVRTCCRSCAPYSRYRYSRATSNRRYEGYTSPAWLAPTNLDQRCGSSMVQILRLEQYPAISLAKGVVSLDRFSLGGVMLQI